MAESADALDSGSSGSNTVCVQVTLSAPAGKPRGKTVFGCQRRFSFLHDQIIKNLFPVQRQRGTPTTRPSLDSKDGLVVKIIQKVGGKMDFSYIRSLNEKLRERNIPNEALESFEKSFDIEYSHHSTAMEGNTLTLIETKAVIEDGISVAVKSFGKYMRLQITTRLLISSKLKYRKVCLLTRTSLRIFTR